MPGADGGVAERLGEEALADADGADEQDVLAAVRAGAGRADLADQKSSELLEAGLAQAQLEPPVVAAAHLVGEEICSSSPSRAMRSGSVSSIGPSLRRLSSGRSSAVVASS